MADLTKLVSTLMSRVQLKAPEQETDLVYQIPTIVLEDIIKDSITVHNSKYNISNIPVEEIPFALWLAEIEVLYMLASGNARFFKIKGQGAELNKQERVKNYMEIIKGVERRYDTMWKRFVQLNPLQIDVGQVIVDSPHYTDRAYRLRQRPFVSLLLDAKTANTADISWSISDTAKTKASLYLLKGSGVIVDEYESPSWGEEGIDVPLNKGAKQIFSTFDPHRTKYRVKDLLSNQEYTVAIIIQTEIGLWSSSEVSVVTEEAV